VNPCRMTSPTDVGLRLCWASSALGGGFPNEFAMTLRHRGDAENRVTGDRLLGRQVLDAVGVEVHHLAVPRDQRRDAGELAVVHQRAHRPLERP
jgi:hypothetical protein